MRKCIMSLPLATTGRLTAGAVACRWTIGRSLGCSSALRLRNISPGLSASVVRSILLFPVFPLHRFRQEQAPTVSSGIACATSAYGIAVVAVCSRVGRFPRPIRANGRSPMRRPLRPPQTLRHNGDDNGLQPHAVSSPPAASHSSSAARFSIHRPPGPLAADLTLDCDATLSPH